MNVVLKVYSDEKDRDGNRKWTDPKIIDLMPLSKKTLEYD
jgi:hypothetical protein